MKKVGRNDLCPCGSGKKFKKCCEVKASKKTIGEVQVLSGMNKMTSLFRQRIFTPLPSEKKDDKDLLSDEKPLNM